MASDATEQRHDAETETADQSRESGGGFAHLHLHTEYSLLDGGNRIDALLARVRELGMDAVAVTDHGNLHGAIEFYTKATAAGVKPILGIEAYVAIGDRRERVQTGIADGGFHLVLLAENNAGWRNLLKLSSDAFLNGFYYKPRMDKDTLALWSDGLIAINGHLGSSLAHHLLKYEQTGNDAHYQTAIEEATWHAETFGTNEHGERRFFVELQRNGVPEQDSINPHLIRLARELNLPLVADNDAHFLTAESWDVHDTLCCISMGKVKEEENRLHYPKDLYVKSPQQMRDLFHDVPEVIDNTVRIARRCNVELDFSISHTPVVRVKDPGEAPAFEGGDATEWYNSYCRSFELHPYDAERDHDISRDDLQQECNSALRKLCEAGLIWRYGERGIADDIRTRLDRELNILAEKSISPYFLIVWDFVNWARQRGIPASARGSGVGTMVGYVLGLSNACPVKYGLLFERFTDPDRSEYPDIDIDICQNGRGEVINYVRDKYGHVAQIITFGRLKARAAIKDVARVMGLAPAEGQRLSNLVPSELHITIDAAMSKEPDFKAEYDTNPESKRVIDSARGLEDHARHAGVHAAGVVVATEPLDNIVPLFRASGSTDVVTQWDGPTCEKVGLLKMDFLGLRTMSTIERARKLIRDTLPDESIWQAVGREKPSQHSADEPHPLDLNRLPYDDQRVLDLFRRGDTAGIFQFESGGMRKLLMEMKPDRLEDLIAANALYRPGPMDLIPEYCMRKHGKQPVPKVHPIVDDFTAETYGIMVYQEQVMQIVHSLGEIPLRAAYTLIKAISKKKSAVIDAERPKFIEGAIAKGLAEKQAGELFDLILKFAGYGFNKSHSTGYSIIAYETAYLKTYFPNQYMAALLTFESQARKVDDWVGYLQECKRTTFADHTAERPHVGVDVQPPDINLSATDFTVVFNDNETHDACHGHIRFGLSALKGIGNAAVRSIIESREKNGPFASFFDVCDRVDLRNVNKATLESLVKCGAFDSLHGFERRSALFAAVGDAIAAGQSAAEDRRSGQMNFFQAAAEVTSSNDPAETERPLPDIPSWSRVDALTHEKDVLGFHASGHPLDEHRETLKAVATPIERARKMKHESAVIIGGIMTRIRPIVARNGRNAGQKMAVITLQGLTGSVDVVVFSDQYAQFSSLLNMDAMVVVEGTVDLGRGEPCIVATQMALIDEAMTKFGGRLEIELTESDTSDDRPDETLVRMHNLLDRRARSFQSSMGRGAEVYLRISTKQGCHVTVQARGMRVLADKGLLNDLREIVGPDHVRLRATPSRPKQANGIRRNFSNGAARR